MATPEPIRGPQHRVARVASRTGLGLDSGRSPGFGRVPVRDRRDAFEAEASTGATGSRRLLTVSYAQAMVGPSDFKTIGIGQGATNDGDCQATFNSSTGRFTFGAADWWQATFLVSVLGHTGVIYSVSLDVGDGSTDLYSTGVAYPNTSGVLPAFTITTPRAWRVSGDTCIAHLGIEGSAAYAGNVNVTHAVIQG